MNKDVQHRMMMNVVDPEEIRVAITHSGRLEELYIERGGGEFKYGNIYKGKVQNIEPSLQAAFIDIGGKKNGFLHVSDVVPPFGGYDDILKKKKRKAPGKGKKPSIEDMLAPGQEVLVQVTRESVSTKGPSLTTYISLPGRYLVLMPAVKKRGVSRKIRDEQERAELKAALDMLNPPGDHGFIIRTAGMGQGKEELENDLDYLLRLWDAIVKRTKSVKAPSTIYQESDLVIRAIRDYLYGDIEELLIDGGEEYERAKEFLHQAMPEFEDRLHLYTYSEPLFHYYGVEEEIGKIISRTVNLHSGGSIVIEQTEALVAIDVNTGKFRKGDSTRETILAINLEAAEEIARQLRLRDLGGLIMVDFIDMESAGDRKKVEERMRVAMRRDRSRATVLPISSLGVMEMTRQRFRQSLRGTLFTVCPSCGGSGLAKSPDVLALEVVRRLRAMLRERSGSLTVFLHPSMTLGVSNSKRGAISGLEAETSSIVTISPDESLALDAMRFEWDSEHRDIEE
ncbi:MAG: Rne/Rng family ribonuclease [Planctomycetes bacterium]|nr:Rne/Rng family ribonuclease [Planctomycetota bacterium]